MPDLILTLVGIVILGVILFLAHRYNNQIRTIYDSFLRSIRNNGICLFRVWIKFVFFFIIFIFFLINIRFLWPIQTGSILINQTYIQLNSTILYNQYSDSLYYCNGFPTCLTEIIAIIGIFAAYCYFFDYIKNKGQTMLVKTELVEKQFSLFFYSLLISILIGLGFISANVYGWLKITSDQFISGELFFVVVVFIIAIVNALFVGLYTAQRVEGYYNKHITRNQYSREFAKNNIPFIFVILFFITVELPIFGVVSGYNLISIFCIDLFILFIMFTLAIFSSPQTRKMRLETSNGNNRDNVIVLTTDSAFIEIIGDNNVFEKIPTTSIISMSELPTNHPPIGSQVFNSTQHVNQRIICHAKKLNEIVFCISCIFVFLVHIFVAGFVLDQIPLLGNIFVSLFLIIFYGILIVLFLLAIGVTIALFGNREDTNQP